MYEEQSMYDSLTASRQKNSNILQKVCGERCFTAADIVSSSVAKRKGLGTCLLVSIKKFSIRIKCHSVLLSFSFTSTSYNCHYVDTILSNFRSCI